MHELRQEQMSSSKTAKAFTHYRVNHPGRATGRTDVTGRSPTRTLIRGIAGFELHGTPSGSLAAALRAEQDRKAAKITFVAVDSGMAIGPTATRTPVAIEVGAGVERRWPDGDLRMDISW